MIMNAIKATANSCKPMCPLFRNSLLASVRVASLLRKFTLVFSSPSAVNQWRPIRSARPVEVNDLRAK